MRKLLVALLLVPLVEALSRLSADTADRAGGALGILAMRLGVRVDVARENMRRTLGLAGPRRRVLLRRAYATMGANFLALWTIGGRCGPERGHRLLNPLWLASVQRRWPGVVHLTLHLGSWDMAGYGVARQARRLLVYAKSQRDPVIDRLINRQRGRAGMEVVFTGCGAERAGAVTVLRALRSGGALGLLADQKPGRSESVPAWFLGLPCPCHVGAAFFARRAGAAVVPGFALRVRAGQTRQFVGRPIALGADEASLVQAGMDRLSAMIAAYPGQYFWHHRRFKRQVELTPRTHEPWRTYGLRLLVS